MSYPSTLEASKNYKHKFWCKQPIVGATEIVSRDGLILSDIEQNNTPTKLPNEYEWVNLNLSNQEHMDQLVTFLNSYYTNNNQFSQIHSKEFLDFYYGNSTNIMLCVKSAKHNLFVGFICGKVTKMQVNKTVSDFIEVRLLCVHQQLRTKKLVPCLITELTRQFNLLGYNKASYSAGIYINKPLISAKYYLRAINVDKLINTGFLKIDIKNNSVSVENIKKANEFINKNTPTNYVKMGEHHIEMAFNVFNKYMEKYNYHPIFTLEEFTHLFYNNKFVETYVYEQKDEETDDVYVLDFASYYISEIEILKGEYKNQVINKGTLFYYTCLNETAYSIIKNVLITANNNNIDVFCADNIMEHGEIIREMNFEEFGQDTHYYLYNFRVRAMGNNQVAVITM
jgi:glycylpeptide N-tetradecanoyltransferase